MELKHILKEVLAAHEKWLKTGGKEGARLSLRNASLQEVDLSGVNLEEAELEEAKLSVADLMGTNLRKANLQGADFWMADMKGTNLEGANLQGASLAGVTNLTQRQVDSAITNASTILPAGLRSS